MEGGLKKHSYEIINIMCYEVLLFLFFSIISSTRQCS